MDLNYLVGAVDFSSLTTGLGDAVETGVETALPVAAIVIGATVVFRVIKRFLSA